MQFGGFVNPSFKPLLNILGLAIGMAVAVMIGLWMHDELTFNKYHKNHDRVAQLMLHQVFNEHLIDSSFIENNQ